MFPQIAARNQPDSSRTAAPRNFAGAAHCERRGRRFACPADRVHGCDHLVCARERLFGENEPADYRYKVVKGTVRTRKVLNDGGAGAAASICPAIFLVSN